MTKRMLIDAAHPEEIRVVIADGKTIVDFDFISASKKQVKGNIYLAKITRVEPSLQAAFVEYGGGKQGFLPFAEIHADYYQIPAADRARLLEEAAREAEDDDSDQPHESGAETSETQAGEEASPEAEAFPSMPALPASIEQTADQPEDMHLETVVPSISEPVSEPQISAPPEQSFEPTAPAEGNENTETPTAEAVETIASEEEEVRQQRKKRQFFKRYKIQEVIRRGQVVLVQVIKEERGNKGASLTTYLSLPGRYCVLMPNSPKDGGISRKIASPEDRKRLKAISTEFRLAEGMSVIIRTAGMDRPRAEIKRDFDYLVKLWNHIREVTLGSTAPALIYEESDIIKRAIRDQYKNDVDDIVIEGAEGFEVAREFMRLLLPSHTAKVKLHSEPTPIFYAYDIEDQLMSMHDQTVKLRSGGYIVINPTEALISIDVNSGRSTGERNIEETAYKTNMEAAVEIARQLRLRDLAGLIVIDFIDMLESRNRRNVERALKDVLKADRAKIQLGRISPFGLLEMSRQRLRPSISETNMVQCPHCEGRGYIRSNESMSIQIVRAIEKEAASGNWGSLRLIAPQVVALHLLNTKRDILRSIEQRHNVSVQILIDVNLAASEFNMEKMRRAQDRGNQRRFDKSRAVDTDAIAAEVAETNDNEMESSNEGNVETVSGDEGQQRNSRRRGRRGGRNRNRDRGDRDNRDNRNRPPQEPTNDIVATEGGEDNVTEVSSEPESNNDRPDRGGDRNRNRSRRGGRNRNRWREPGSEGNENRHQPSSEQSSNVVPMEQPRAAEPQAAPLPAFTQRAVVVEQPPAQPQAVNLHGDTPRDQSSASKKGWWQKMINLDD